MTRKIKNFNVKMIDTTSGEIVKEWSIEATTEKNAIVAAKNIMRHTMVVGRKTMSTRNFFAEEL